MSAKNIDDLPQPAPAGSLKIIAGPMMSGKSTELLRLMIIEADLGSKVIYINHSRDDRTDEGYSTHNPLYKDKLNDYPNVSFIKCEKLPSFDTLLPYDSIYFDEFQFYPEEEEEVFLYFRNLVEEMGKHIVVSGLISNFRRRKFGNLLQLMLLCDDIIWLKGVCERCNEMGRRSSSLFTIKISGDMNEVIEPGKKDKYKTVCRDCYISQCH